MDKISTSGGFESMEIKSLILGTSCTVFNNCREIKTEELEDVKFNLEDLHHSIDIKEESHADQQLTLEKPSRKYDSPNLSERAFYKKWQPETVQHLICLYELQPLLYDVNAPAYYNKISRNVAIDTIANDLTLKTKIKFTTDEVVKKINTLRTQFLNAERSRKSGSGSSTTSKPTWWLYENMQFLLPFTRKDRGDTNSVNRSSESTHLEEFQFEHDVSTIEPDEHLCQLYSSVSPMRQDSDAGLSRANSSSPSFGSREQILNSRKRKRNARDTLKKMVVVKENSIDLFTTWIGSELKEIKNNKIIKTLKRKIISLIEEAQDEDELH